MNDRNDGKTRHIKQFLIDELSTPVKLRPNLGNIKLLRPYTEKYKSTKTNKAI